MFYPWPPHVELLKWMLCKVKLNHKQKQKLEGGRKGDLGRRIKEGN